MAQGVLPIDDVQQSIVAVRTESLVGVAAKGGVEVPVEKKSTENREEAAKEVTEVLVEKESQTAEHRQSATPPDSEEEDLQLEGGAMDLIMDDFDRPVVSPKDPPDKKVSSSKNKKKRCREVRWGYRIEWPLSVWVPSFSQAETLPFLLWNRMRNE
ncbi:hypothetical protein U1Q18_014497, partial [Sarracenia purpurea var. burkii]